MAVAPKAMLLEETISGQELDIYEFELANSVAYRSLFSTFRWKRNALCADLQERIQR